MITKMVVNSKAGTFTLEGTLDTPTPSASGKTNVVLSTHGNVAIADETGKQFKVGLNLYTPKN